MNKRVLKFIKATAVSCFVLFLSLLVWANWSPKTYTEKNVPSDARFLTFEVPDYNAELYPINIEKEVGAIDGISTCSYNSANKIIGVIFYTSKFNSNLLQEKLSLLLHCNVAEKKIEAVKGGCPVGGIKYFMLGIKQSLNFRQ